MLSKNVKWVEICTSSSFSKRGFLPKWETAELRASTEEVYEWWTLSDWECLAL